MCFALHDICVLHPFSNLVFEILLGSMFIEVCHSKARHCRYSFDVFTCIYIYAYIHIFLFDAGICTFIYILPCGRGKGGKFSI